MKKIIFLFVVLIALEGCYWLWQKKSAMHRAEAIVGKLDFNEEGTLIKDSKDPDPTAWYFSYKNGSQIASSKKLQLGPQSSCIHEDQISHCDPSKLQVGMEVSVVGRVADSTVEVAALTFLKTTAAPDESS